MVAQPFQVVAQVGERERVVRGLRLAVAARVPRDDPVPRAKSLDLRGEHLVVHEQAVRQDERRQVPARVLEVDPLAIDFAKRHPALPQYGSGAGSNELARRPLTHLRSCRSAVPIAPPSVEERISFDRNPPSGLGGPVVKFVDLAVSLDQMEATNSRNDLVRILSEVYRACS